MKKIKNLLKNRLKGRVRMTEALLIVFLITGIIGRADGINITEPTQPAGLNIGTDSSIAIGKRALSTGEGTTAIGKNSFASGNNMAKEEYEKFIADNNARIKEIETKISELNLSKDEINKLKEEHKNIVDKLARIDTYRKTIAEKETNLANREPEILKEIEIKKGERVKYTDQIIDLENRLKIINSLNFDSLDKDHLDDGIAKLAVELKAKMENGITFLKEYGADGIPVEEYKNSIYRMIETKRNERIEKEVREIDNYISLQKAIYNHYKDDSVFVDINSYNNDVFYNTIFRESSASQGGRRTFLGDKGNLYTVITNFGYPINEGEKYRLDLETIKNVEVFNYSDDFYRPSSYNIMEKEMLDDTINSKYNKEMVGIVKEYNKRLKDYYQKLHNLSNSDVDLLKEIEFNHKIENLLEELRESYSDELIKKLSILENKRFDRLDDIKLKVSDIYTDEHIALSIEELKKYTHQPSDENKEKLIKLAKQYYEDFTTTVSEKYRKEIDRLRELERDTADQITIKETEIEGYKSEIQNLKDLLASENPDNLDEIANKIKEKENAIKNKEKEIQDLKAKITKIKDGENAIAYGTDSIALGKNSISIGKSNYTNKESSVVIGTDNIVDGEKSTAIGNKNIIFGANNFVLGNDNVLGKDTANVSNNIVLGSNININGVSNAIVLGNESEAVSGAVSVGKAGTERQIKNVKDATDNQDAVTLKQLKDYVAGISGNTNMVDIDNKIVQSEQKMSAGIANAIAQASVPQVASNRLFSVGASIGHYNGESAVALGISGQTIEELSIN